MEIFTLEPVKFIISENSCHLSCSVRAEVHKDNSIIFLNSAVFTCYARNNKFIGNIICIRVINCFLPVSRFVANAENKSVISLFLSIPVVISVHSIVTTCNSSDFAKTDFVNFVLQIADKAFAIMWVSISTVSDTMKIELCNTHFFSHIHNAVPMVSVRMNTACTNKSH